MVLQCSHYSYFTAVQPKNTVLENKASSLRREASSQYFEEKSRIGQKRNTERTKNNLKMVLPVDKSNMPNHSNTGYRFLRSKTTIDMRTNALKPILRNEDGIPYVSPLQRYELQLLFMEDILRNGISGKLILKREKIDCYFRISEGFAFGLVMSRVPLFFNSLYEPP